MSTAVPRSRSALPAPHLGVLAILMLPALPVLLLFLSAIERAVFPPPDPDAARVAALNRIYAHPTDAAARRALARLVGPSEAIPHLAVAARMHPDDSGLLCELGNAYRDTRSYDKAAESYRKAVRSQGGSDPCSLCSLGSSLVHTRRRKAAVEAIGYLQRAAELSPDDAETQVLLGDAEEAAGRHFDARSAWERAMDLDPEGTSGLKAGLRLSRGPSLPASTASIVSPKHNGLSGQP